MEKAIAIVLLLVGIGLGLLTLRPFMLAGALVLILLSIALLIFSRKSNTQQHGIVYQLLRKSGRARVVRGSILVLGVSLIYLLIPLRLTPLPIRQVLVPLILLPGAGLIAIIVFAAGVVYILLGIRRLQNPGSHPAMKKFAQHGNPQEIIQRIETEMAHGAPAFRVTRRGFVPNADASGRQPKYFFTSFCLLAYERNELFAVPYEEIVWAYQKVIKRNSDVSSKAVVINDRQGQELQICLQKGFSRQLTKKEVDLCLQEFILAQLAQYAPWALFGFSEEYRSGWYGQDKQAMIRAVEQRREHFQRQAYQAAVQV